MEQNITFKHLTLPLSREDAEGLRAGDYVMLSGTLYTARDAAHKRMAECLAEGKPLEGDFREFLSGIEVRDKKVCTTLQPDMDYLSGADCRSLDAAIARCKDADPYDLSDMSHDAAWQEAIHRIKDDPQKNFITLIDMARAGHAPAGMVDYIREKQLVRNALSC